MCTHNLCYEQKLQNHFFFHLKIIFFSVVKNRKILHKRVIVMCNKILHAHLQYVCNIPAKYFKDTLKALRGVEFQT